MYTVYGIPNCDTVKKAVTWLKNHHLPFEFHDYKKKGITLGQLKKWSRQTGWETLLNKKGTTWRELDESVKAAVLTEDDAIALMQEHTSMIKRPVITLNNKVVIVGFNEASYAESF